MPKYPRPNQTALTLPPQLRERLKTHSERTGLSVSEIIRTATTQYLDQQERTMSPINASDVRMADHFQSKSGKTQRGDLLPGQAGTRDSELEWRLQRLVNGKWAVVAWRRVVTNRVPGPQWPDWPFSVNGAIEEFETPEEATDAYLAYAKGDRDSDRRE